MDKNKENWQDIGKEFDFDKPEEADIEEMYCRYHDTQCLIDDIMRYKGVSREKAEDIFRTILRYEQHGYKYDWTIPEIDFDLYSRYYWTKYRGAYKLIRKLKDEEMLKYAKAGVLTPHIETLKSKYPLSYKKYITINRLAREAYYAYLKNRGRFDLQCDREYAIEQYKLALRTLEIQLNNKSSYHEEKNIAVAFDKEPTSLINNPGIIIGTRGLFDETKKYSPLSFDEKYYVINELITEALLLRMFREETLNNAHDAIVNQIDWLESISLDELYRDELIDSMQLSDEEKKEFDEHIFQYKKDHRR